MPDSDIDFQPQTDADNSDFDDDDNEELPTIALTAIATEVNTERWKCRDPNCDFECVETVRIEDFIGVPNLCMLEWMVAHKLSPNNCSLEECTGVCHPVPMRDDVALKCNSCWQISNGGRGTGFWRKTKAPYSVMVAIVYAIVAGFKAKKIDELISLNKNTHTTYMKRLGGLLQKANAGNTKQPSDMNMTEEQYQELIKRDALGQFRGVPWGKPHSMALIEWRVRHSARQEEERVSYFKYFCETLYEWTNEVLDMDVDE